MKKIYLIYSFFLLGSVTVFAKSVPPNYYFFPDCSLTVTASTSDESICIGAFTGLATTVSGGTSPYTYSWLPTAGLTNPYSASPVAVPTVTTVYTVTVTDAAGCTATSSVDITVGSPPTVNADTLLAQYLTHETLTAIGGEPPYTYTFSPTISTSSLIALLTATVSTTYTATVTGANGCSNTYYPTYVPLANALTGEGACATLFFSEYIQDTIHHDDAIEIYNPTSSSINLSSYYLAGTTKGSLDSVPFFISLHGTIASHSTYLICNTNADTSLTHRAGMLSDSLNFGGKDIVTLAHILLVPTVSCSFLDMVGVISPLPTDSGWAVGSGSTKNHTLTRETSVVQGDLNWTSCALEWNVYPRGTFTYIGDYENVCDPKDPYLYLSFANDTVSCGDPGYFNFDVMVQADSAKKFNDGIFRVAFSGAEFTGDNLFNGGIICTKDSDNFGANAGNDYNLLAVSQSGNEVSVQLGDANRPYFSPHGTTIDTIPKAMFHFSLKIQNSCQTGTVYFDSSTTYTWQYTKDDSTFTGIDTTVMDSLTDMNPNCPYNCDPYSCEYCCSYDSSDDICLDSCTTTCYLTCYDTCYDTIKVFHYHNVYSYSNDTDIDYTRIIYSGSLNTFGCSPIITYSTPKINAGTNNKSDPANSSILTIEGSGFGSSKGLIFVPDANKGGAHFMILDTTDMLSWSENKIVVRMPSAMVGEDTLTPGSGGVQVTNACSEASNVQPFTINYSIINFCPALEKYRCNIAMLNDSNSLVFRCDTSISNHLLIYAVVQQAIATWDCYTGVNWKLGKDTTGDTRLKLDGVSSIYFTPTLPGNNLMETRPNIDTLCSNNGDSMTYVYDADIAIRQIPAVGYTWNYNISDTVFPGNYFYFFDVLMHELGHAQLLNHVDDTTSLMYWSNNGHKRLNIESGVAPGPQTLYGAFDVVNTSAINTPPCAYHILIPSARTCIDHTLNVPSISKNEYNLTLYPNPASNGNVTIAYQLNENSSVQFTVTDCTGRQLMSINKGFEPPGQYAEPINISTLAQGVYLFITEINGEMHTLKFIKL